MTESSFPWSGIVTGDAGPYTDQFFAHLFEILFSTDQRATQGVLRDYNSELIASGASSPVSIATGAAIVDGELYETTSNVSVTIPTPASLTRIDRIVLRKDFTGQTVRVTRIAGSEGGAAPAITQSDGTTWDVKLYQVSITTGGVITLTDERQFCEYASLVNIAGMVCEGRLTLTTATPVTTADVTSTSVYFTPMNGNRIALRTAAGQWRILTFSEITHALGTVTSGLPYDFFAYIDSTGAVAVEKLAWTNSTTRATALALQDGVLVKSGDTTRRYLGTIYTISTTQTQDAVAARYVWNYYNRRPRTMEAREATDTWTYNSATYRQANAASANQLNFVIGVSEDAVICDVKTKSTDISGGGPGAVGIGVDSTSTNSARRMSGPSVQVAGFYNHVWADYIGFPGVGRHFLAWLETVSAGTASFQGDNGVPTTTQFGISGIVWA